MKSNIIIRYGLEFLVILAIFQVSWISYGENKPFFDSEITESFIRNVLFILFLVPHNIFDKGSHIQLSNNENSRIEQILNNIIYFTFLLGINSFLFGGIDDSIKKSICISLFSVSTLLSIYLFISRHFKKFITDIKLTSKQTKS